VFAPAAALLASGEAGPADLGPDVADEEVVPLLLPLTESDGSAVSGETWWIDRYGNVQTNVSPDDLAGVGLAPGDTVTMRIGAGVHNLPWVGAYGDAEEGEALLHVDSSGLMAIAVRAGRADERFDLAEGVSVTLAGRR
jgi:S-adenosylmethionine hydrolase